MRYCLAALVIAVFVVAGAFAVDRAYPGLSNVPPFYPPNAEKAMVKNDFDWMAKNRARILELGTATAGTCTES